MSNPPPIVTSSMLPTRDDVRIAFRWACGLAGIYMVLPIGAALLTNDISPIIGQLHTHIAIVSITILMVTFVIPLIITFLNCIGNLLGYVTLRSLMAAVVLAVRQKLVRPFEMLLVFLTGRWLEVCLDSITVAHANYAGVVTCLKCILGHQNVICSKQRRKLRFLLQSKPRSTNVDFSIS